jgi:hypothetical protein
MERWFGWARKWPRLFEVRGGLIVEPIQPIVTVSVWQAAIKGRAVRNGVHTATLGHDWRRGHPRGHPLGE